jgi:radical SAM-linked protein
MKAQRLRVTFGRGDDMKYVTHLDMMRFWERALRRAGVPLSYSEGFSPHAQIAMAAPLAVGVTGDAELMDVFLQTPMRPRAFAAAIAPQLPPAVWVVDVREAALSLPALQADMRAAEYEVDVPVPESIDPHEAAAAFLASETIPWEHRREDEVRQYDIRAMVRDLTVARAGAGTATVRMTLKNDSSGSGRPEQVAAALGFGAPTRIHRTRLVLEERSRVLDAWRKHGKYAG